MATASAPHGSFDASGRPDAGAAAAWTERLYAEHARLVAGLCRALLRDRGEAEDAAQQTFLSAHRALLNGAAPREPAAWLATIARNECWARISSRMREPLPSVGGEPLSSADPVQEALRRADLAALWQAIRSLPSVQRDALLLREFGGLTYEELAVALAVSEPAVESLLFRARRTLRARLRTAYAATAGASWLEALGRLLAGGGAPAAAKVAALGVGAAALGSGAVVVPRVFDNHHPAPSRAPLVVVRKRAAPRQAAKRPSSPKPVLVAQVAPPAPAPVRRTRSVPPPLRIPTRPRHDDSAHETEQALRPSDGAREQEDRTAPPETATIETATIATATVEGATTPQSTTLGPDGGDGRDGGSGDGGDSGGSSSGDGGT